LLRASVRGEALARELAAAQSRRLGRALKAIGPDHRAQIEAFLLHLVEQDQRATVSALARPAEEP
jgi:hypothetical protein